MAESPGGGVAPPPVGSRLAVRQGVGSGRWGGASVAAVQDGRAQLEFEDGSTHWAQVVAGGVLLLPQAGKRGKRSAGAASTASASSVRPFHVLAPDATLKGRPTKAAQAARDAAVDAAEEYLRQQQGGGDADGAPGSPAKRRRTGGSKQAADIGQDAEEEDREDEEMEDADGERQQEQKQQQKCGARQRQSAPATADGSAANGKLASPAGSGRRRLQRAGVGDSEMAREAAVPLAKSPPAKGQRQRRELRKPGAGAAPAAAAGAAGEPAQAEPMAASPAAAGQPEGAAAGSQEDGRAAPTSQQLAGEVQQAGGSQPPAAAAAAAPAAALRPPPGPKRSAVTELGSQAFSPLGGLARLGTGQPPAAAQLSKLGPPLSGAAPGGSPTGQQLQQRPESRSHRHKQQQQQQGDRPRSRGSDASKARQGPQDAQQQPSRLALDSQEEEGAAAGSREPAAERPGDAACRRFEALLPGLTGYKESIQAAAQAAIEAGQLGACREAVRSVVDHMEQRSRPGARLPFFYLLDAMLARSRRDVEGCGPESVIGKLFPRAVGAALGRLVELLGAHRTDAEKMEKTLQNTWAAEGKRGVDQGLVQHALQKLRERIAQHEAAWAAGDAGADGAAGGSNGLAGGGGAGAGGAGGQAAPIDMQRLREHLRRMPMRSSLVVTYMNVKDGSRVQLARTHEPPAWPDYDELPLPPGAEVDQFGHPAWLAAHQLDTSPHSPWRAPSGLEAEVADEAQQVAQIIMHHRLQAARAAGLAAHAAGLAAAAARHRMYEIIQGHQQLHQMARAAAAAQAAQSAHSTAAEADEFDMGLFKEAAGGVSAAHLGQQQQQQPDLMGEAPWAAAAAGGPPLPPQGDQPPLPDEVHPDWVEDEDEESMGPPPLPPHSPPRDEYEMDTEEDAPPLPPDEEGEQQQQQQQQVPAAAAAAAAAAAYPPPPWAAYSVPPGFGVPPPAAMPPPGLLQAGYPPPQLAGWPAQPHPSLPPGIGIAPPPALAAAAAAAAWQRQQAHAAQRAHQQQYLMTSLHHARASAAAAAAAGGLALPPGMPPPHYMLYSPAMNPGMNPRPPAVPVPGQLPAPGMLPPGLGVPPAPAAHPAQSTASFTPGQQQQAPPGFPPPDAS